MKLLIAQLTARKVALTKAGKIDDALLIDETIADISIAGLSAGTALKMGEVYIETNTRAGQEFFLFRPDQTYVYTSKGGKAVQRGKWNQVQEKTILTWDNQPSWGTVEITIQDTGALKIFRPTKNWTDEAKLATEAESASFKAEIALLKNDVPSVTTANPQVRTTKLSNEALPFVGVWVREGSGTQFNFAADGSVEKLTNKGASGNTDYDKGTWRVERSEVLVEFQKGIKVRFRPKGDGSMDAPATSGSAGDWKVKKKP